MTPGKRNRPAGNGTAHKAAWTADTTLPDAVTFGPDHEPSAWLRGLQGVRLAEIDALELPAGVGTVVGPLGGRSSQPGTREDRTCDRCRTFVPAGRPFVAVVAWPRPGVVLFGGLCAGCTRAEGVTW